MSFLCDFFYTGTLLEGFSWLATMIVPLVSSMRSLLAFPLQLPTYSNFIIPQHSLIDSLSLAFFFCFTACHDCRDCMEPSYIMRVCSFFSFLQPFFSKAKFDSSDWEYSVS